ncbi:MAG: histidinol-phosphate transaminase [Verrucomicrobiota bacterium]
MAATENFPLRAESRRHWLKTGGAAFFGSALAAGARESGDEEAELTDPSPESPVRMMYNENPVHSSKVRAAMTAAFEEANSYSYFRAVGELKEILAELNGVTPAHIVVGAGSTEVLRVTALHLMQKLPVHQRRIAAVSPGYEGMNRYAENLGAKITRVPVQPNFSPNLDGLAAAVEDGAAILNLCNPNNPTGVIVPEKTLTPFCRKMAAKTFVFVDEAYHEFVTNPEYGSMLPLAKEGLPVMVTRTFSKMFGLAGTRIGYGIGSPDLVSELEAVQTGTINIIAIRAAMAALKDEDFQRRSLESNEEAKAILFKELAAMGRQVTKGEGNFVFFHTGMPIQEFEKKMFAKGFWVGRPFPPYLDWCRLSMSTPMRMKQFCAALGEVLAK